MINHVPEEELPVEVPDGNYYRTTKGEWIHNPEKEDLPVGEYRHLTKNDDGEWEIYCVMIREHDKFGKMYYSQEHLYKHPYSRDMDLCFSSIALSMSLNYLFTFSYLVNFCNNERI